MLNQIKAAVKRTKKFAEDHPTISACAVTALVSWKFSHDVTLKSVLDETAPMAYEWGRQNGVLQLQNVVMLDFINEKGLAEEMREFIRSFKDYEPQNFEA